MASTKTVYRVGNPAIGTEYIRDADDNIVDYDTLEAAQARADQLGEPYLAIECEIEVEATDGN